MSDKTLTREQVEDGLLRANLMTKEERKDYAVNLGRYYDLLAAENAAQRAQIEELENGEDDKIIATIQEVNALRADNDALREAGKRLYNDAHYHGDVPWFRHGDESMESWEKFLAVLGRTDEKCKHNISMKEECIDCDRYPCMKCGKLRTKDEGGTTFTVCDTCWDK